MDPRSVPLDGGVFSRSIPVSSHTPRLGMLTGASSDIKSKCWEQYQHQQTNRNDNRLKTFGTTYLSDDAPRVATVTSLDGSRRRFFQIQINLISHMELYFFFIFLFNLLILCFYYISNLYHFSVNFDNRLCISIECSFN